LISNIMTLINSGNYLSLETPLKLERIINRVKRKQRLDRRKTRIGRAEVEQTLTYYDTIKRMILYTKNK